jgi:hypothetical protein
MRPKAEDEAHVASTVTSMDTSPEIADSPLSHHQGNEPLMVNKETLTHGRLQAPGLTRETGVSTITRQKPATLHLPHPRVPRYRHKNRENSDLCPGHDGRAQKERFIEKVAPATLAERAPSSSNLATVGNTTHREH